MERNIDIRFMVSHIIMHTTFILVDKSNMYIFLLISLTFFNIWVIFQQQCLSLGITIHKVALSMMIVGPLSIETTTITGTEVWTQIGPTVTTITGIITISMTSLEISGTTLTTLTIMLIFLVVLHPWKGENLVLALGETLGDILWNTSAMKPLFLQPATILSLLQDQMLRHPRLPAANVTAQNWKMMNRYLCRGMRLRDTPHQEKMVLMHYEKPICGILTVHSFRILDCGLSCKCLILSWVHLLITMFSILLCQQICSYVFVMGSKKSSSSFPLLYYKFFLPRKFSLVIFSIFLHTKFINKQIVCPGLKPLLVLPWFCAIVSLFEDHMLAMIDLWVRYSLLLNFFC